MLIRLKPGTEGNLLFNDTFIYGYMVKDNSDSESGNSQPPLHGLLIFN